MQRGKLYLIPTVISDETQHNVIGNHIRSVLPQIRFFLAENVRTARRFLSSLKIYESIEPLHFDILDKDTTPEQLHAMFKPVFDGESIGVLSESGCPGIADPGALAVEFAHKNEITVVPLVGPSSILLALMGSGLNGQKFAFNGYLPIEGKELSAAIREFEKESRHRKQTQIFIETPHRNAHLMNAFLKTLHDATRLTVAIDITGKDEWIRTYEIRKWKVTDWEFAKTPTVFLFLAS